MASPRVISPQVRVESGRDRTERPVRKPSFPFNLKFKPWQLQPCFCAPVLPGETVMQSTLQVQAWSDPLAAVLKNTGWTFEYYQFYTRFIDLAGWEIATDGIGKDLQDMIVSDESISSYQDADGNAWTYCPPGGVDFLLEQTKRITEVFFRFGGEAWDERTLDGVPIVGAFPAGRRDVWDKLTLNSAYADRRQGLDFDASGTITVDDIALAYKAYGAAMDGTVMDMDFDDWARAAGGKAPLGAQNVDREDKHLPEAMCHHRKWTYPTNTVEPSTGVPAVAVGWREEMKTERNQMIACPTWGWITGYIVVRPKVYYKNQEGLVAAMMQDRDNWFPPQLDARLYQPHLLIDDDTGPLKATMGAGNVDYWVSLCDLLRNGEQFLNYAPAAASTAVVTLPTSDGKRHYPSDADIMAVFSDTTNGRIRADGIVNLAIKSHPAVFSDLENLTLGKA